MSLRARILYTFVLSATCVWYTLVTLVFRYCVLWYVVRGTVRIIVKNTFILFFRHLLHSYTFINVYNTTNCSMDDQWLPVHQYQVPHTFYSRPFDPFALTTIFRSRPPSETRPSMVECPPTPFQLPRSRLLRCLVHAFPQYSECEQFSLPPLALLL